MADVVAAMKALHEAEMLLVNRFGFDSDIIRQLQTAQQALHREAPATELETTSEAAAVVEEATAAITPKVEAKPSRIPRRTRRSNR